ncbi:MAG: tRNA (adenosine(37)-N6)-threonylcarbamoyltransferase complex ATPase subunit type 1 TsaE [bacterium]|nr:tRNA (adenosine(37)-N6)-threonylcarbamoyltransferase complex ATPase subunit type 1 TsaE [bacterium]
MKILANEQQLEEEARALLLTLTPSERATILALHGDLGAGKTAFTQALARELGITETVVSPTFVIMKVYDLSGQIYERLIHIDAYRLDDARELSVLGWSDMIQEPGNLIVVEWAERVKDILPIDATHIYFEHGKDDTRTIRYDNKEN